MKNKILKITLATISIAILLCILTGCGKNYDRTETKLVQATVVNKHRSSRRTWKRKVVRAVYKTTLQFENLELTTGSRGIYDALEEGNQITVQKIDYYKENELIKSELKLIQ